MTVEEAVERAYKAFAHHGLPPVMEHCDHCFTPEDEARLHAPLRTLSDSDVFTVVAHAVHLLGDERDFRHFAPRVLADVVDGSATDETWYLKKFRDAGFAGWPEAERRAVSDVLDAAWERRLATFDPTGHEVEGLLCGIGHVLLDLAPLLDAWGCRTDRVAVANLASSMVLNAGTVTRGETPDGAWWDEDDLTTAQYAAWLRAPERREQVAAAYGGSDDELDAMLDLAARLA